MSSKGGTLAGILASAVGEYRLVREKTFEKGDAVRKVHINSLSLIPKKCSNCIAIQIQSFYDLGS